ncbi:MAG: CPBP family intramembrane glutamic endopeptidase [Myxococcota bacterium]
MAIQVGDQTLGQPLKRPPLWGPGGARRPAGRPAAARPPAPRASAAAVPEERAEPGTAPAQRYRIRKAGRYRVLTCVEAPTVQVRIERGFTVTAASARSQPPGTIFLDGAAQGEPFLDPERGVYNLDHHEGCIRSFTLATCEQAMVLLRKRLDLRKRDWTVHANDADLDTVLAIWVLLNHLRLADEDSPTRAQIMPLLRLEGCIDALGLEFQDLCALPPELLDQTRARMAALLRRERALKANGSWDDVDPLQYVATQLQALDQMVYPPAEISGTLEIEELARADLGGGSLAVVCRAKSGIYEVERELRRVHGERLGMLVLQKDPFTYSLRQVDPSLPRSLERVYARLNLLDPGSDGSRSPNRWGGSEEIGGSPRSTGTRLSPRQIAAACGRALSRPNPGTALSRLLLGAGLAAVFLEGARAIAAPPPWLVARVPELAELTLGSPAGFASLLFALAGAVLFLVGRRAPGLYGLRSPAGLDWWGCLPLAAAGAAAGGIWIPMAGPSALAFSEPATWALLLIAPAAAEILFRGLVHGSLARTFGIQLSGGAWSISLPALGSSAVYAVCTGLPILAPLVTTRALVASPSLLLPLGGAFAFGLACAMARERSESIIAPVAFHWLCAAGVLVSGSASISLG